MLDGGEADVGNRSVFHNDSKYLRLSADINYEYSKMFLIQSLPIKNERSVQS